MHIGVKQVFLLKRIDSVSERVEVRPVRVMWKTRRFQPVTGNYDIEMPAKRD